MNFLRKQSKMPFENNLSHVSLDYLSRFNKPKLIIKEKDHQTSDKLTSGYYDTKNSSQIAIVFFDAASGHRSAAAGLRKELVKQNPTWNVKTINITDIFDYHRSFGKIVRLGIGYFNRQIKRDKIFDLHGLINLSLLCHDLTGERGIKKIARFWEGFRPDAVISVTPMYNPVLYKSAKLTNPFVKCITIPVDFEEVKPRYWFTPGVEQHYLNATDHLTDQALRSGIHKTYVHDLSGMIADPDLYSIPDINRLSAFRTLGIDPELPTGFISFGGQGCNRILEIAREAWRQSVKANFIFMCGKNESLYQEVTALKTSYPKVVFRYLPETPVHYLHLSDFAIGKPGAMTITEALITGTPLIALKSKGMSPVQRGNEQWIERTKTGIVAKDIRSVVESIHKIISDKEIKNNILNHKHNAITEAAHKIKQIIDL